MKIKPKKKQIVYVTTADDGVNYREISDMMTEIGFKMNHSSARNYVLRVMRKFATAIIEEWDLDVPESSIENIVKTPQFQNAICEILKKTIEAQNMTTKRVRK